MGKNVDNAAKLHTNAISLLLAQIKNKGDYLKVF